MQLPVLAGMVSTALFMFSTLPMIRKAVRTRDLRSYSLGNILLANGGNLIHSIYVFSLPPGPIWLLHSFHVTTTGLMLAWYARYEWHPRPGAWPGAVQRVLSARARQFGGSLQRNPGPSHRSG